MDTPPPLAAGHRARVGAHRATVRYVGSVQGQEGQWVGLEWDEAGRGKHDGTVDGTRYFTCAPGAGSFVRAAKVQQGCSVLAALLGRYSNARGEGVGGEGEGEEVAEAELYVHTVRQRRVRIQVIGADKITALQSQTQKLLAARLVGAGVSHVGSPSALATAAASLEELDLTSNLVHSWAFVCDLLGVLPSLRILNLSDNRLALPSLREESSRLLPLPSLKALVLNDCSVSWHQVLLLEPSLPCLEELHLAGNGISSLAPGSGEDGGGPQALIQGFQCLKVLSLEDNQLPSWAEVARLAALPSLAVLHISGNPIPGIHGCPPRPLTPGEDVDQLDRLPRLQELRLTGNPLLEQSKTGGRFEIIGRVGQLRMLNGSGVTARERQDGEIRYMQKALSELQQLPEEERARTAAQHHPRLPALAQRYGSVLGTATQSSSSSSLASSMLEVTLTCVAAAAGAKMGSHKKRLPASTTLGALRTLCERLCKVRAASQRISIRSATSPFPEAVDEGDDKQTLSALGVQDGSELFIDEWDAVQEEAAGGAGAGAGADLERSLAQHELTLGVLRKEFRKVNG